LRGLSGRIGRLENGRAEPCPECGWDGDWSNVEIVVDWANLDRNPARDDPAEPKWCEACGHQLEYVVTWTDLEGEV
jgi:hypothetical protein